MREIEYLLIFCCGCIIPKKKVITSYVVLFYLVYFLEKWSFKKKKRSLFVEKYLFLKKKNTKFFFRKKTT
jgi:hypothetical protein